MASPLILALLSAGTVLAWRRALDGPPAASPAAFTLLLLSAGLLAPDVAGLALGAGTRPAAVPATLTLLLALGLAACARPQAQRE